MHIQKNEEVLLKQSSVAPYAVFQITKYGAVTDYGVGVLHASDRLVTFKKHFKEGRELGRIFFKKLAKGEGFPLSYDFSEENPSDYIVNKGKLKVNNSIGDRFISIQLDDDIDNSPNFLSARWINEIGSCKKGYAVGFDKQEGGLSLHKMNFDLDTHIMDLRLKYQTAILFVQRKGYEYCYGFYEEQSGDKNVGYDLYLSKESLEENYSQNETFVQGQRVSEVYNPAQGVPFQSIGMLNIPGGGYGTAQLLRSQDGCRYLITCAHNFLGVQVVDRFFGTEKIYNYLDKASKYTFSLPKFYNQSKPLRYVMKELEGFEIKNVYIPDEYKNVFQQAKLINNRLIKPNKKSLFFSNLQQSQPVDINTLYDIAIIELKENIKGVTHGFTIEDEKPIKFPVEVSGYPEGSSKKAKHFGIKQGNMYTESTASHQNDPNYVKLYRDSEGNIIMKHKLSTLPGNSGSAIYERESNTECRLLAIHTTGVPLPYEEAIKQKNKYFGAYNYGTYIHSPNIKSWINKVFNK